MKAEIQANVSPTHNDIDEFKAVTRLIALNAVMEAAKIGREGAKFASVTNELLSLARDAVENDDLMAAMIDKQTRAIDELAAINKDQAEGI